MDLHIRRLLYQLIVSCLVLRYTNGLYCNTPYTCYSRCSSDRMQRDILPDGGISTQYHACAKTCTRQVCCKGYTGSDCNTAICFGETSCWNNNPCIAPDTCSCKAGYSPPRCEDINECSTNKGGCQHDCTNTVGSYVCSCRTGFTLASDQRSCTDVDECSSVGGICGQVCINTAGSFRCSCRIGYKLASNGKDCLDEDECAAGTAKCDHSCTNTVGSYVCTCRQGYTLKANGYSCNDVDECSQSPYPCDQSCINTPGSYRCDCQQGYRLNTATGKCEDIDECGQASLCQQLCTNTEGSYTCSCRAGYLLHTDGHSCSDIDECTTETSKCAQLCNNTVGSYKCSCKHGYSLDADGYQCSDVDDCQGVTCQNTGDCVDNVGSYTCFCSKGYTGTHCEIDVNECAGFLNGGCEDQCINTPGSFHCQCTGNKTLNDDGVSCLGSGGPSVFSRYGLIRRFLPRGCHTILLATCANTDNDVKIMLSSTAQWYKLRQDPSRIFTYGIVFAEANALALPVSISGMEVIKSSTSFEMKTGGLLLDIADGDPVGEKITAHCWSFLLTPKDIRDFLLSNSFLATYFHNIEQALPDWLWFSHDGFQVLGVNDLETALMTGDQIETTECRGAPLYPGRFYTLLKFGSSFLMTLYGQEIRLPAPLNNRRFCIIVDVCQDFGGSVFLMLPEESRDILDRYDLFKRLIEKSGLFIRPYGIGISIKKRIFVNAQTTHMKIWNGDEFTQYPVFPEANLWMGGQAIVHQRSFWIQGEVQTFLSIPSPVNIIKSLFLEEWGFVMNIRVRGHLRFQFDTKFGNMTIRGTSGAEVKALASLGGDSPRRFCGRGANPAGVFFSFIFDATAFVDAPILRFVKPDVNVKVYAFLASDPKTPQHNDTILDVAIYVIDLKNATQRFIDLGKDILQRAVSLLKEHSVILLRTMINTALNFLSVIEDVINNLGYFIMGNLKEVLDKITGVWRDGWKQLRNDTEAFLDAIRENTIIVKYNITKQIQSELRSIWERVNILINNVTDQASLVLKDMTGVGFRFNGSLNAFGLKVFGVEIEMVYSVDRLGACSRYELAYKVLKGERAMRSLAVVSTGLVKLGPFFRLDVGGGAGIAQSLDDKNKFAVVFRVQARLLGAKAQADLFITNQGLTCYLELNIWDVFKAQIELFANIGSGWNELAIGVKGRFVADADNDGDFDDSYLTALTKYIEKMAGEADKRISAVQDDLTQAQNRLTKAQDWLESKKQNVRNANAHFDAAIRSLEDAKDQLESAKKPFNDAISKLSDAQRKVDNLCSIWTCRQICIPGIQCRICHRRVWGVNVPYPCCGFTKCMFKVPDPICVARNVLCRAVRALAYAALEAAKVFVRIPMLALDAAKGLLSAAQFVVDKARVVLEVAVAALDLAKLALEAAKGFLEINKIALEAVKQAVKLGIRALNFIIQYGIKNIIDVKNCEFEVSLSVRDIAVFDVMCEINAFQLGWRAVRIRINFRDIFQSLWNAARSTITNILQSINIAGRKRREIEFEALNLAYKQYRRTRDLDITAFQLFMNSTDAWNTSPDSNSEQKSVNNTDDEYDHRTKLFAQKCSDFTKIFSFLSESIMALMEMSNETATTLLSVNDIHAHLLNVSSHDNITHASLTDLGIDTNVASSEFNITVDNLTDTVLTTKANLTKDPFLQDVEEYTYEATLISGNQTKDANSIDLILHWLVAMDNTTKEYFDEDACVSFLDCTHHAVALLYDMIVPSSDLENKTQTLETISSFEDTFLNLTSNDSHSVLEVYTASKYLQGTLNALNASNVFCSIPPTLVAPLSNTIVPLGKTLQLECRVNGEPTPVVTWFKDGDKLTNASFTGKFLVIHNVSKSDQGRYHCTATNVVTTLEMADAVVSVADEVKTTTSATTVAPENEEGFPVWGILLIIIGCLLVIPVLIALVLWGITKWKSSVSYNTMNDRNVGGSTMEMTGNM